MEVILLPDPAAVTALGARILAQQVRSKPASVLGLATGQTMIGVYARLVALQLDGSQLTCFNLDEYVGLGPSHPASYRAYMEQHFYRPLGVDRQRAFVPDGLAEDIEAECLAYERRIEVAGGLDLQLLGLGEDGHIGFNEPGSSLASRTRLKTLTPTTRAANQRDFGDGITPLHVLTMGVATILSARRVLLLAYGAKKAEAVAAMVEGPVTAMCPASALQFHPACTVVVDEAAGSHLRLADYYRTVYTHKPEAARRKLEGPDGP